MHIHEAIRSWSMAAAVVTLVAPLAGCAAPGDGSGADRPPAASTSDSLACTLPSNCVSSIEGADPGPLRFEGTAQQALTALRATLGSYPEATVVRGDGLEVQAIFTTTVGFRDQVDFRVDPQGGRVDYRSKSLLGLYDFGKNRSRMREFAERFARQRGR